MPKVILLSVGWLILAAPAGAQNDWRQHRTQHYVIFYQNAPESFVESLASEAEDLFGAIARDMGFDRYPRWRREERIKIYVYDNREAYENAGRGSRREGTRGMAHIRQRAISTFRQDRDSFLNRTLPHELGHIFFYEFVGARADVPGWFSEGIAMAQEKGDHRQQEVYVKELIDLEGYFSLNNIPEGKHTDIDYFYPVAYSATNYLLSRLSTTKLFDLFELLREGRSFEAALAEVTNNKIPTVERLNRDWIESISGGSGP